MLTGRRACLAIGISDAGGGLDYLGGALQGAKGMHAWATALGYESALLTDEKIGTAPAPVVDIRAVADALTALLPRGSATERLILYFAGHGLITPSGNDLWLLNRWREDKRAVAVQVLQRRLREFGVAQIAVMADACRKLPASIEFSELAPDPALGSGFTHPQSDPLIDRFTATQDGQAAYMIPGVGPGEEDRCLFSGVLLEGLWGQREGAYSKRAAGQVISTSLASFLRDRGGEIATKYGLKMEPQSQIGFPEERDIYFDRATAPAVVPKLPPWPAPPKNEAFERAVQPGPPAPAEEAAPPTIKGRLLGGLLATVSRYLVKGLGTLSAGTGAGGSVGGGLGELLGGLLKSSGGQAAPAPPTPTFTRPPEISEAEWERWKAEITLRADVALAPQEKKQIDWLAERGRGVATQQAAQSARQALESSTLALIRQAQAPPLMRQGLVVAGPPVLRLWAPPGVLLSRDGAGPQWAADGIPLGEARPLWVEFEGGSLAACVLMAGMVTRLGFDASGATALVLQPGEVQGDQAQAARSVALAETAIAQLASGTLDAATATDLASGLFMDQHLNPVLGVISAYLYDAVGDIDSIRRMACFYLGHRQAIPYDIAFLAELRCSDRGDGVLQAQVPAQGARRPRSVHEGPFIWATTATEAVQGPVAGRLPWLRQGWPYVAAPSEAEKMMAFGLAEVLPHLLPSQFTALQAAGGPPLIHLLQLEPQP